ncbi:MAG: hypothetical protein MJE12_00885, partial [Alphaproteobacteria bacterium]|nr:hypothetical protein [Alphaproteobacteria bacterium]
ALKSRKRVHYEFLDNSVADGARPRTVAFGWNGAMNILDVKCLIDVDRFRKINIDARSPDAVYADIDMAPEKNLDFLQHCAQQVPLINFADFRTGHVYAQLKGGAWAYRDGNYMAAIADEDVRAALDAIGNTAGVPTAAEKKPVSPLEVHDAHTLGEWGADAINVS